MKAKGESKKNYSFYLAISFVIIAAIIIGYVLFLNPQPGVADQGDFDRVMSAGGISVNAADLANPNFKRFYDYTVDSYSITGHGIKQFFLALVSTSVSYVIYLVSRVCELFRQVNFKTEYMAICYSIMYLASLYLLIRNINIKNKIALSVLCLVGTFILLDGNYLIWFNSFYGEPMMISTFILFIATYCYYIKQKYILKNEDKVFRSIVFILIAIFLFLGSKMQTLTAVPIILIVLIKILWDNRKTVSRRKFKALILFLVVIIIYPAQLSMQGKAMSKDTQYNSVFYGVLNGSKTPKEDLEDLGLNPDMYVEAGKHSYLNSNDYVKYVPRTEITEQEFYSKMSNGKLAKFYLTHPVRLIEGMQYTAEHAFSTSTSLGKYPRSYSEKPITEFNRFTTWSSFKMHVFPKNLIFILSVYIAIFAVTIYMYSKNKGNKKITERLNIILIMIFVSGLQFPMPFVGNGRADTSKQLFLFNFIFDLLILISISWVISSVYRIISEKIKERRLK